MSVETATFIHDLAPANPLHTDPFNTFDAQIRLIKQVLQNTFPFLTGAVTTAQGDLNGCTGLPAAFAALSASVLHSGGGNTTVQQLSSSVENSQAGTFIDFPQVRQGGSILIPSGFIGMWSGSADAIPSGWLLCDGTNGTPDLRGRFVLGASASANTANAPGGAYGVGTVGGNSVQTIGTTAAGLHNHSGADLGHSLTVDELPPHTHSVAALDGTRTTAVPTSGGTIIAAQSFEADTTGQTGSGNPHTHGIGSDGNHSHAFSIDVRPDWYALAFILKT